MDKIKFAGLIPLAPLTKLSKIFLVEDILALVDTSLPVPQQNNISTSPKNVAQGKLPPFSGFACFIYGQLFEMNDQKVQPNYQKAFSYYQLGVTQFLDPLCAYRLAEIYSQNSANFKTQANKDYSYCYLILSTSIELYYGMKDIDVTYIH